MPRNWSTEEEVALFSLICDHKPAGPMGDQRLDTIARELNNTKGSDVTAADVWSKLELHFNMKEVTEIENESDNDKHVPESKTPANGEPQPENELEADIYSSELSDVEGDMSDMARLKGEDEDLSKKVSAPRGRRKSTTNKKKDPVSEEPAARKRTRSVAKLGGGEAATKRRQSRSSPSASTVKRRTRSELTPDPVAAPSSDAANDKKSSGEQESPAEKSEGNDSNASEEASGAQESEVKKEADTPKTRRSTRQSVRRSGRKK